MSFWKSFMLGFGLSRCRVLGWHQRPYGFIPEFKPADVPPEYLVGFERRYCHRCGHKGLVDSQGNLF